MASLLEKFKFGSTAKLAAKLMELEENKNFLQQQEEELNKTEQRLKEKQVRIEIVQQKRNESEEKAYQLELDFSKRQQAVKEAEEQLRLLKQQEIEAEKAYIKEKEGVNEKDREIATLQKELGKENVEFEEKLEKHKKDVQKYNAQIENLEKKGINTDFSSSEKENIEPEELVSISSVEEIAVSKEEEEKELTLPIEKKYETSETIVLSHIVSFPNLSTLKSNLLDVFNNVKPLPHTLTDNGLGEIFLKIEFSYQGEDIKFFISLHKETKSLSISYLNKTTATLVDVGSETADGILIKQEFEEKTINDMLLLALRTTTVLKM